MKKVKLFAPPRIKWGLDAYEKQMKKAREFECYSKFGLLGFSIESNSIKLDQNNFIRRVSLKERKEFYRVLDKEGRNGNIQDYIKYHQFMLIHHYKEKRTGIRYPDKVSEFRILCEMFFRIFLETEVSLKYDKDYVKDPKSGVYIGLSFGTSPRKDLISNDPPEVLPKHTANLIKKLWKYYDLDSLRNNKSLQIIIRRFYDSAQRLNDEDAIIDLMIALEALFLNENSELNHRLALRISKLLEPDVDNQLVYDFIKKAYIVRSKVAHGSTLTAKYFNFNNHQYDIGYFIDFLGEILRLSLVRYFLEFRSLKIHEFQNQIDQAIISSTPIQQYYIK